MKSILFLLISLITSQISFSQSVSFEELLELYKKGNNKVIDDSTASNYFEFEPFSQAPNFKTGQILWASNNQIALTTITDCSAGGLCKGSRLSVFSSQGIVIDRISFEFEMADCVFLKERDNIFISDSLLTFTDLDYEVQDCGDDENEVVIKNELQLEFVFINLGKFQRPIIRKINTQRKYYVGSTKFLRTGDLQEFSKEEYPIIRNEIFEAHGYTFSTSKWKEYFSKQDWHEPIDKNVDEYISMIERHNIKVL